MGKSQGRVNEGRERQEQKKKKVLQSNAVTQTPMLSVCVCTYTSMYTPWCMDAGQSTTFPHPLC